MGAIYKITCIENGKFYIGSTVNLRQRWARHRKDLREGTHPNRHMLAAWNAYGEASFRFEVLESIDDPAMLFAAEQRYLDEHAGKPYCFNWAKYAGAPMRGVFGEAHPNFGKPVSDETRQKLREASSGERNPRWGKPLPDEIKAKISEANKTNPWRGSKHTPEAIEKIRAASIGRKMPKEAVERRAAKLRGREVPLDVRLRISQTLSGEGNYWYGKKRPESFSHAVSKPVIATSPDGVATEYPSIQALREALDVTPPTVNRALKSGRPLAKGRLAGWSFAYKAKELADPTATC